MEHNALTKVQRQAEETIHESVIANHTGEEIEQLVFHLGEINAANIISRNLESAVIVGLQRIRDERKYTALGYQRFDDFLDNWHRSPMKYKRFNHLEGIHDALGPAGFDLMRGSGLSYRQMKMLEAGDIIVEGQDVVIGGQERVSLGESRLVKDLVEKLIEERTAEKTENEKLREKVTNQKDRIEQGAREIEEIRRNIDEAEKGTPYQLALMALVKAFITLTSEAVELDDSEKPPRGSADLETIAGLYFQLSEAFGVSRGLDDPKRQRDLKTAEPKADADPETALMDRAIAEMTDDEDDF
ncbi:MAG: hypothetical protein ABI539_08330 [Acidobacteriota bacterium]